MLMLMISIGSISEYLAKQDEFRNAVKRLRTNAVEKCESKMVTNSIIVDKDYLLNIKNTPLFKRYSSIKFKDIYGKFDTILEYNEGEIDVEDFLQIAIYRNIVKMKRLIYPDLLTIFNPNECYMYNIDMDILCEKVFEYMSNYVFVRVMNKDNMRILDGKDFFKKRLKNLHYPNYDTFIKDVNINKKTIIILTNENSNDTSKLVSDIFDLNYCIFNTLNSNDPLW